jgi:hypothetical protein
MFSNTISLARSDFKPAKEAAVATAMMVFVVVSNLSLFSCSTKAKLANEAKIFTVPLVVLSTCNAQHVLGLMLLELAGRAEALTAKWTGVARRRTLWKAQKLKVTAADVAGEKKKYIRRGFRVGVVYALQKARTCFYPQNANALVGQCCSFKNLQIRDVCVGLLHVGAVFGCRCQVGTRWVVMDGICCVSYTRLCLILPLEGDGKRDSLSKLLRHAVDPASC